LPIDLHLERFVEIRCPYGADVADFQSVTEILNGGKNCKKRIQAYTILLAALDEIPPTSKYPRLFPCIPEELVLKL
jgi:hypothetical protein